MSSLLAHARHPQQRRGRRRRAAGGRLPARRVDRARLLPGRQARQADPGRGPGRRGQDRAGQGARSRTTSSRDLVRLQCYEGLDEAKALYEWNYRKQLLRIQAEAEGAGWQEVQDDIFGAEFLLQRPLMSAIAAEEPVVLLIDEIDKTDQEFEAMLLELLSDFQISIPELGRFEARTRPVVLLTSNNSRELTEALKRRCLYLWLDYPSLEHELEIVKLHAPELGDAVARKLVEVVAMIRELDLKKPPSIAESIDWARALLLLGADDIDGAGLHRHDVDHRQAPHRPRRRGRARRDEARACRACHARRLAGARRSTAAATPTTRRPGSARASSSSARSCAARASRSARASCSTRSPSCARCRGREPERLQGEPGRDAGQVPGGPADLRPRLRPLLLPRRRDGGRARGRHRGRRASTPRAPSSTSRRCASRSPRRCATARRR